MRLITFLAVLLRAFPSQSQVADVQRLFQQALELQQHGDLQGAVATYRKLLQLRNDVPPAHANLGVALAGLGQYQEAIANYREALRSSENSATRLNLALAYYKLGDLSHAIAEFEILRRSDPANVQATELAADCYLRLGDNKRAIATVEKLSIQTPDDLALQYLLGTALICDHQSERGKQVIALIAQHGENPGANLLIAQVALSNDDYPEANLRADRAIAENPKLPDAYTLSGIAKEGLGQYESAQSALKQSLALDPSGFDANLHLGALMLRNADYDSAERFTASALRIRASSPAALYQMGLVQKGAGHYERALECFQSAEKISPDWLEPHVQLASLYYRLKRPIDGLREREFVSRLSKQPNPVPRPSVQTVPSTSPPPH